MVSSNDCLLWGLDEPPERRARFDFEGSSVPAQAQQGFALSLWDNDTPSENPWGLSEYLVPPNAHSEWDFSTLGDLCTTDLGSPDHNATVGM